MASLQFFARQEAPIRLNARFECAPGELLALVGPSGAGKTSVLRVIAGLLCPSEGQVSFGDDHWLDTRRSINLSPQRRRVGLVFQNYALFPHMSALDNVAAAAQSCGHPRAHADKLAAEWLERMSLAGFVDRRPAQLSGGQQQRVALARALAREPQVLLLDEPFSAVDQVTRQQLQRELVRLCRQLNIPIVLVTHDLAEAATLADQLVILDRGESLQQGAPARVLRSPRNARVADLVGLPNHFAGTFERRDDSPGHARLWWGAPGQGEALQVIDKGRIDDQQRVTWVVATGHLSVEPAGTIGVNCIAATLDEVFQQGDSTICMVRPSRIPDTLVRVALSARQARSLGLDAGAAITLNLEPEGIHVMPLRDQAQPVLRTGVKTNGK